MLNQYRIGHHLNLHKYDRKSYCALKPTVSHSSKHSLLRLRVLIDVDGTLCEPIFRVVLRRRLGGGVARTLAAESSLLLETVSARGALTLRSPQFRIESADLRAASTDSTSLK